MILGFQLSFKIFNFKTFSFDKMKAFYKAISSPIKYTSRIRGDFKDFVEDGCFEIWMKRDLLSPHPIFIFTLFCAFNTWGDRMK